jgi:hypothetical protein
MRFETGVLLLLLSSLLFGCSKETPPPSTDHFKNTAKSFWDTLNTENFEKTKPLLTKVSYEILKHSILESFLETPLEKVDFTTLDVRKDYATLQTLLREVDTEEDIKCMTTFVLEDKVWKIDAFTTLTHFRKDDLGLKRGIPKSAQPPEEPITEPQEKSTPSEETPEETPENTDD